MRKDTVVQLRQPGTFSEDPLTEVLRLGARRLLARAVEMEVTTFVEMHADLTDGAGRRRIVRHGYLPEREIQTGIGPVAVRCPRVRDRGGRRDGATDPLHLIDPAALSQARQVDRGTPALALSEGHLHGRFLRGACGAPWAGGARAFGLHHCPPQGGLARRDGALATARSLGQALRLLLGRRHLLLTTARRQAMHPGDHRRR